MNIVKQEKITENNLEYIVTEYSNGTITKELYSEPSTEPQPQTEPTQTLEEQISEVQDNQLVIMDAVATSYEKDTELSENQLVLMDAIASLYEAKTM